VSDDAPGPSEDEVLEEIREAMDHLHPRWRERIENERCPNCGEPGRPIGQTLPPLETWACPTCEPEAFEDTH
jgi:hypothetical protein